MHTETYDPSLKIRRNELGLRFLYKLRSNNKNRIPKHLGWQIWLKPTNQTNMSTLKKYETAERDGREPPGTNPLWLLNNTSSCYDGES